MSDPGTGKTRAWIEVCRSRIEARGGKVLVLAPKTILVPAWGRDILRFAPELKTSVAYAKNRAKAFQAEADIYITNHDAIKWVADNWGKLKNHGFHTLIVDEMTAFKHRTSQRSKALAKVAPEFEYRYALSGTPNPNGLLDLWHQVFVLDGGEHLGPNFFKFRMTVCEPKQVGPNPNMQRWDDRIGAAEAVSDILSDMTIRHVFEECIDIPEHSVYTVHFALDAKHQHAYNVLRDHAVLELSEDDDITAFNAAVLANKLLQMASGAVYDEDKVAHLFSTARHELVIDLVEQRDQCVVAFNWRHQIAELTQLADARGLSYRVIDGTVSDRKREQAVELFQAGLIKVIFAHPASASHGLTLTRGTSTIWASPVYNAEHYHQFNRRIYRAGQTRKTETILVTAENTLDVAVAAKLMAKIERMDNLLDLLS